MLFCFGQIRDLRIKQLCGHMVRNWKIDLSYWFFCGIDFSFCSSLCYYIAIYTILFLSCRELITEVMQQVKVTICVRGHKEVLRLQKIRLMRILIVNQLEISYVTMKVLQHVLYQLVFVYFFHLWLVRCCSCTVLTALLYISEQIHYYAQLGVALMNKICSHCCSYNVEIIVFLLSSKPMFVECC